MGFTRRLVQFASDSNSLGGLPPGVVERSKEMMVNAAAVALAAAAQPECRIVTKFVQDMQGNGRCTIIGMGLRTSPVYAALANGTMVHLLDFDDEIAPRNVHPSSAIFPAVMALGEMFGNAGHEVLTAYILGCEVVAKLAGLAQGQASGPAGHADSITGTVGATISAGLILKLEPDEMEHALGIACGQGGGIAGNLASGTRALECGRAALNGVMGAMLAKEGLTAAPGVLEQPGGYFQGQLGLDEVDEEGFFEGLAKPFAVVDPGVTLKLYPCATASHTTIEALLQLMQQYQIEPGQVQSVRVAATPEALERLPFPTPQNHWEARLCLSYIAAATLLHGHPLINHFSEGAVQDPEVRVAMDRITVEATGAGSPLIPNPSVVTVTLDDGRRLQHRVDYARGYPEFPLEREELDAKFLYCSRYILPADHIEEAIDSFRDLENIENVTGMVSVLGG